MNQNSLLHHVLKARYFEKPSFMEAQLGKIPSYVWRSIVATRSTIKRGLWWNIGNGHKVDIWKDRWLPTPDSFNVVSPKRQGFVLEKVENLLDLNRGGWDIEKVRSTFLHHEAEVILGIPISPGMLEDSQSWAWTKNGEFSIRSAYSVALKILKENKMVGDGGGSSNS